MKNNMLNTFLGTPWRSFFLSSLSRACHSCEGRNLITEKKQKIISEEKIPALPEGRLASAGMTNSISLLFLCLVSCVMCLSCVTTAPLKQPTVNSLVNAQRAGKAVEAMTTDEEAYGDENVLLYWLDRGMAYHLAEDYVNSIRAFAQAQRTFDKLYTRSLSQKFATLILNDYFQDYRGEDYEYVLMNIFQAFNYVLLGEGHEALVEARDMDNRLRVLAQLYEGKNHIYQDDAFARLFMGILYESAGGVNNLNDAYISYQKAIDAYAKYHEPYYGLMMPDVLKENILALSQHFSSEDYDQYRARWPGIDFLSLKQRQHKGQLMVVEYAGYSPVKVPEGIIIPVEKEAYVPVSLPKFYHRFSENDRAEIVVKKGGSEVAHETLFVGQDLTRIAQQIRERKKVWLTTKSIIRPVAKYLLQREARRQVEKKYGKTASSVVNAMVNAYNVYSEQTDLRTWQTLPNQIRLRHFWLDPGVYDIEINIYDEQNELIDQYIYAGIRVEKGQSEWIIRRTYQ